MDQEYVNEFFEAKYSPLLPNYLSLLSGNDLQVMEQTEEGYKMLYCEGSGTRFDKIWSVEWSRDPSQPLVLAAGFENGKVSLISYSDEFGNQISDDLITGSIVKEFNLISNSRSKRKWNALAWNLNKPALLAAGYDMNDIRRSGTYHSIVIWDVNKESKANQAKYELHSPFTTDMQFKDEFESLNPKFENVIGKKKKTQAVKEHYQLLNKRDDTTALTWMYDENDKLLSGSYKGVIRMFDLQGSTPIEFNNSHK